MLDVGGMLPQAAPTPQAQQAPQAPVPPAPDKSVQIKIAKPKGDYMGLVLAIVTLIISAGFFLAFLGLTQGKKDNVKEIEGQVADVEKEINSPQNKSAADKLAIYNQQFQVFKSVRSSRTYYSRAIGVILARLPRDSKLSTLSVDSANQISLEASGPDIQTGAKGYVSYRDYAIAQVESTTPSTDLDKIRNAFSAAGKTDIFTFQLTSTTAVALYTQGEPQKYKPEDSAQLTKDLGNWKITTSGPAFQQVKLNSVTLPGIGNLKEAQPKSSFSLSFIPDKSLFKQPYNPQAAVASSGGGQSE